MQHGNQVAASQLRRIGFVVAAALAAIVWFAPTSTGNAPTETTGESTAAVTPAPPPVSGSEVETRAASRQSSTSAGPKLSTPAGPQLSIAVDNGKTSAVVGDKVTYTISVQNLGTTDADKLWVTQTMPTGLTFVSADTKGTEPHNGTMTWNLNLKATETATFHTTMTVGATPADLLRLATVACAGVSKGGAPIVCASHSDQLPAGAAADASAASDATTPASGLSSWWYVACGIALVVAIAALAVLLIRRRATPPTDGP